MYHQCKTQNVVSTVKIILEFDYITEFIMRLQINIHLNITDIE